MPNPSHLGVDFGTSHTVAVLRSADGRVRPLLFDDSPLLPSAVFVDADGALLTGADAVHGSQVAPERFEPNPKRCIDDGTVLLGDQEFPVTKVFAAVLGRVRAEAMRVTGTGKPDITLTHPAAWGPTRRHVLADAAEAAGLGQVRLVPEPVAAATYFAQNLNHPVPVGKVVVVADFGGGTYDASVVSHTPGGFSVLSVDGRHDLGGLDFDEAIFRKLEEQLRDHELWPRLASPENVTDRRHRWTFLDRIRAGKERLSRHTRTDIVVPLLDVEVQVTREELEEMARPLLNAAAQVTRAVIREAGNQPGDTAGIFLVGGASRMPLVATVLHQAFGMPPTVLDQPELVVAEGSISVPQSGATSMTAAAPSPPPMTPPMVAPVPVVPAGPPPAGPTPPPMAGPPPGPVTSPPMMPAGAPAGQPTPPAAVPPPGDPQTPPDGTAMQQPAPDVPVTGDALPPAQSPASAPPAPTSGPPGPISGPPGPTSGPPTAQHAAAGPVEPPASRKPVKPIAIVASGAALLLVIVLGWMVLGGDGEDGDSGSLDDGQGAGDVTASDDDEPDSRPSGGDQGDTGQLERDYGDIGEQLAEFVGHSDVVQALAVVDTDDGPILASGSVDETVRLWDPTNGERLGELDLSYKVDDWDYDAGSVDAVEAIDWKGDPALLVVTDDTVQVWDPAEQKRLEDVIEEDIYDGSFAMTEYDGTDAGVSFNSATVSVTDLNTGLPLAEKELNIDGYSGKIAVSEVDGAPVLVVGDDSGTVTVWDMNDWARLGAPSSSEDYVEITALTTATDVDQNSIAVTGDSGGNIKVSDLSTMTDYGTSITQAHVDGVQAVEVVHLQAGTVIVSAGADGTVKVWDLESGAKVDDSFTGHTDVVYALAVAKLDDDVVAFSGSGDATIKEWDLGPAPLSVGG